MAAILYIIYYILYIIDCGTRLRDS